MAIALGYGLTWLRVERMAGSRLERPQIATFLARIERVEPLPARESTRLLLFPVDQPDLPERVRLTIRQDDADAFRRSGLAHLLSVSGLPLTAAVGATMLLVLRLLALWPWLASRAPLLLIAAGTGAVAGIAYTLLTGSEVPTVRSLIAALIVLAGIATGREAMTLRLVATGALIVLLLWPESSVGPSFQLSFAAILSIVALHDLPAVHRLRQARRGARPRDAANDG